MQLYSKEIEAKPKKGPAPPPPKSTPPPSTRPTINLDTTPTVETVGDSPKEIPASPVLNLTKEIGQKEQYEVLSDKLISESEEVTEDSVCDSEEDDDLSPEKDRVLQMLDSVIQEQEESLISEDDERLTPVPSEQEQNYSLHSPVHKSPVPADKQSLLSTRPTSISPGASRPETPKSLSSISLLADRTSIRQAVSTL